MRPFNLEEYLKDPSRKVVTRDGRKVSKFLCTDAKSNYPIVTLVEESKDDECVLSYTTDGEWCEGRTSDNDLFFASEKKEGWQNIYKSEDGNMIGSIVWPTKEEAERNANTSPTSLIKLVATIKVEWEE